MKKIGLFFGTFNPIHVGHLAIGNHIQQYTNLDQVWFVVTPQSPFKTKQTLLDNYQRLEMVYLATKHYDHLQPSDIEFALKQPNYTINTLTHLNEKFPSHEFSILMGEDNLNHFHKWKNYERILDLYQVYVYPRISKAIENSEGINHSKIHYVTAPIMEISSSFIRNGIKNNKIVSPLLPNAVWHYIDIMNFYK